MTLAERDTRDRPGVTESERAREYTVFGSSRLDALALTTRRDAKRIKLPPGRLVIYMCSSFPFINPLPYPGIVVGAVHGPVGALATRAAAPGPPGTWQRPGSLAPGMGDGSPRDRRLESLSVFSKLSTQIWPWPLLLDRFAGSD